MNQVKEGDWLYCFMGEKLIHFVVTIYDTDMHPNKVVGEDAENQYTFYLSDCYLTKEDAISGMLKYIGEITECDCGEDEGIISNLCSKLSGNFLPNCS